MALTLFWRCEGTTFDGTHDYTAGDGSATATGAVSISATAAKVGSNGVLCSDAVDYYSFDSASIVTIDQGSIGAWIQYKTAVPGSGLLALFTIRENTPTQTNDYIAFVTKSSQEIALTVRKDGGAGAEVATTAANLAVDNWYFVTGSWHLSQDKMRMRVYDASGTLVQEAEDTATDLSSKIPASVDTIMIGNTASFVNPIWIDNVFIGDDYADADTFHTKRNIMSYTEYASSSGTTIVPNPAGLIV